MANECNRAKRNAGFELVEGVVKVAKNPDSFFGGYLVTLASGEVHNVYCEGGVWRHGKPKGSGPHATFLATSKGDVLPRLVARQAEFIPQ